MEVNPLASITHPDFNDVVVHFCGREGPSFCTPDVRVLNARDRLLRILAEQRLRAFPMFGVNASAACFTESTRAGVQWLLGQGRYPPYGLAFSKRLVFARGGGPALYVRGDEWKAVEEWPANLQARATRLWPGARPTDEPFLPHHLESRNEWTIEREWRVLPNAEGSWPFEVTDIAFLIVGDAAFMRDAAELHPAAAALPHVVMDHNGQILGNQGVTLK